MTKQSALGRKIVLRNNATRAVLLAPLPLNRRSNRRPNKRHEPQTGKCFKQTSGGVEVGPVTAPGMVCVFGGSAKPAVLWSRREGPRDDMPARPRRRVQPVVGYSIPSVMVMTSRSSEGEPEPDAVSRLSAIWSHLVHSFP